jgi:hypothetical protein
LYGPIFLLPVAQAGAGPTSANWTRMSLLCVAATIWSYCAKLQRIVRGFFRARAWLAGITEVQDRFTRMRVAPSWRACRRPLVRP